MLIDYPVFAQNQTLESQNTSQSTPEKKTPLRIKSWLLGSSYSFMGTSTQKLSFFSEYSFNSAFNLGASFNLISLPEKIITLSTTSQINVQKTSTSEEKSYHLFLRWFPFQGSFNASLNLSLDNLYTVTPTVKSYEDGSQSYITYPGYWTDIMSLSVSFGNRFTFKYTSVFPDIFVGIRYLDMSYPIYFSNEYGNNYTIFLLTGVEAGIIF
jgi:hypothetical protein